MDAIVYVDSWFLTKIQRVLGYNLDYKELQRALTDFINGPVRIYFYTCTSTGDEEGHIAVKPLIDWLSYNGYIVRHKTIMTREYFEIERRAYVAAHMTLDALSYTGKSTTMFFCTSNPEFADLIKHLSHNNFVNILDSEEVPAHQDLRQNADTTINLERLHGIHFENTKIKEKPGQSGKPGKMIFKDFPLKKE